MSHTTLSNLSSKLSFSTFVYAFIAGMSGLLFGYYTGVMSGVLVLIGGDFIITPLINGVLVGVILIGAAIGSLSFGSMANRIGPKRSLTIIGVVFILAILGDTLATSIYLICLSLFVTGLAIGISSFIAPSYISEISPKEFRGSLISIFQLLIVIGILLAYLVNFFVVNTSYGWRGMFFCGIIPAVIFLIGTLYLPNSPRWLISKNKDKEALQSLNKIRGYSCSTEFEEIKLGLNMSSNAHTPWYELFKRPAVTATILAASIKLFTQLCGINAVIYYLPQVFIKMGAGVHNSLFIVIMVGVANLLATIIGILLLDRVGRRPLMICGASIITVSLLFFMFALVYPQNSLSLYIALVSIIVFIFGFAFSFGVFGWVIISEIFPNNLRHAGASLGAGINWLGNILVSFCFPIALHSIGLVPSFAFFLLVSFSSLIYCWLFLPETKGVSLEVIEKNLLSGIKSKHLGLSHSM